MKATARLSAELDHWKGIPKAAVWQPIEVIEIEEGNLWYPGENATVPYGYTPGWEETRLVGFVYTHWQIEGFLFNQLNEQFIPKVEEMQQWLTETTTGRTSPTKDTREEAATDSFAKPPPLCGTITALIAGIASTVKTT